MSILTNYATTDRQKRALELHIEGNSYRQISKRMFDEGFNNKDKPFTHMTIKADIQKVVKAWESYTVESLHAHRTEHYTKANYIWNEALKEGDLKTAIESLKLMMQLLGTKMPERHEVSHEVVTIGLLPVGVFDEI
jgi:hypothetical protein